MNRRVVLKRLDDDCLLEGQLHPTIRERLNRVRELPLTTVASLIGVEKSDGVAQLVWEFVPGRTLEEIHGDAAAWARWAREVILAVEALHAAGIVHGAIHERNVIVDAAGQVRLTHVSPLLHNDRDHDAADVLDMLEALVARDAGESELAKLLSEARSAAWPLGLVYAHIVALEAPPPPLPAEQALARSFNLAAVVGAIVVAAMGMTAAAMVLWYLGAFAAS
jgi:hypothetical protein